MLPPAEQQRAARFHTATLRDRFIVAHGRLRQLLAGVTGVAPDQLEFDAGPHGKPHLAAAAAASGVRFNLSHSDSLGLVGWAQDREVGVDIERWRVMRDEAALVQRYFAPAEIDAYHALSPAARMAGFFACWTRKEAYVKAVGRGIALELDSFVVSLEPGADARLMAGAPGFAKEQWSLAAPDGPEQASLAVAMKSPGVIARCRATSFRMA